MHSFLRKGSFVVVFKRESKKVIKLHAFLVVVSISYTLNPRISPLGAYLFLIFLDGGLFEGGAYKIIVDIKKTLLKDLVYFSRNFSISN